MIVKSTKICFDYKHCKISEAGRIRKDHLENDESQVKIHVDRIGHNIQDSVYMEDSDKKNN